MWELPTKKTPNTDTFYVVNICDGWLHDSHLLILMHYKLVGLEDSTVFT